MHQALVSAIRCAGDEGACAARRALGTASCAARVTEPQDLAWIRSRIKTQRYFLTLRPAQRLKSAREEGSKNTGARLDCHAACGFLRSAALAESLFE